MGSKKFKFIKIALIVMVMLINIGGVRGIIITSYGSSISAEASEECSGTLCATDLTGAGLKITLLDENGNSQGYKYFWPSSTYEYLTSDSFENSSYGSKSCKGKLIYMPSSGNTDISIGLPTDINSSNAYIKYENYIQNLTPSLMENIIKEIKGVSSININNYLTYYLKFEPIYIMREFINEKYSSAYDENICFHYAGTTKEILNSFGDNNCAYSVSGCGEKNFGFGIYYVNSLHEDPFGSTFTWNATRNYIVSMYVKESDRANIPYWPSTNGNLADFKATEVSTNLSILNDYYKAGNGLGVGYAVVGKILGPKITIEKYTLNEYNNLSATKLAGVGFTLFEGDNCQTRINSGTTDANGNLTFSNLDENKVYSLKESSPIEGYDVDTDACITKDYNGNQFKASLYNPSYKIGNKKDCVSEFQDYGHNLSGRINLFKKYTKDGHYLNKLLNMNITNATDACNYTDPSYSVSVGCLEANVGNKFTLSPNINLSNYDEIVFDVSGDIAGFCTNSYVVDRKVSTPPYKVKSGQKLINSEIAAISKITKQCYMLKSGVKLSLSLDEYISNFSLNYNSNEQLNNDQFASDSTRKKEITSIVGENILEVEVEHKFLPIWLMYGSGERIYNGCADCRYLEYGVISSFIKGTASGYMPFEFGFNKSSHIKISSGCTCNNNECICSSDECTYELTPELITPPPGEGSPELELEFRVIDIDNPFPGKNGANTRNIGLNWRTKKIESVIEFKNKIEESINYSNTNNCVYNNSDYDLNKDGITDNKDLEIFTFLDTIKVYDDSLKGDNYLSQYVMSRNNTKKGETPKYSIRLTASDILEIRKYNENKTYDDYNNLDCDKVGNCNSEFLTNLKDGVLNSERLSGSLVINNRITKTSYDYCFKK